MDVKITMLLYVLFFHTPLIKAAVPGTYFWNPRVKLQQSAVPTLYPRTVKRPTVGNIYPGLVVIINGYKTGMTVAALATIYDALEPFKHLNPSSAYYYTNMYRWMLRYMSNIPEWFTSNTNFVETHKVWNKRFFYMDKFVPHWLRKILWFVKKEEWEKEEKEWIRWAKYAEPGFGKYYKYPSKRFNNWNSMRIVETIENLDITDASI